MLADLHEVVARVSGSWAGMRAEVSCPSSECVLPLSFINSNHYYHQQDSNKK